MARILMANLESTNTEGEYQVGEFADAECYNVAELLLYLESELGEEIKQVHGLAVHNLNGRPVYQIGVEPRYFTVDVDG
jgi:hypothetical protein